MWGSTFSIDLILLKTDSLIGHVAIGQWGNGFKLKESEFRLGIRKTFFTKRAVKH